MRTCGECGYLLPETWDTCKRCGAPVAAATVGAVVAPLVHAAPAPAPSEGAFADRAPSATPYDPRFAAPVRIGFPAAGAPEAPTPWTQRSARSARRRPWSAVVVVIVVVALGAGGWFGWKALRAPAPLPAEARAYIGGAGVMYEPFGQGFRVRMARAPVVRTETVSRGGVSVAVTMGHVEQVGRYEMLAGAADLGVVLQPDLAQTILSGVATGIVATEPGIELVDQRMTQFEGWPALDAKLTVPDGHPARVLVVLAGSRIVMIFTHATSDNDDLFEAMRDSLELVP